MRSLLLSGDLVGRRISPASLTYRSTAEATSTTQSVRPLTKWKEPRGGSRHIEGLTERISAVHLDWTCFHLHEVGLAVETAVGAAGLGRVAPGIVVPAMGRRGGDPTANRGRPESEFIKALAQLRKRIIDKLTRVIYKSCDGKLVTTNGETFSAAMYYTKETVFLVTDVSTFDDGDLRISGYLVNQGDKPTAKDAYTVMGSELDTCHVEDLLDLLGLAEEEAKSRKEVSRAVESNPHPPRCLGS